MIFKAIEHFAYGYVDYRGISGSKGVSCVSPYVYESLFQGLEFFFSRVAEVVKSPNSYEGLNK